MFLNMVEGRFSKVDTFSAGEMKTALRIKNQPNIGYRYLKNSC
jgi:hypothetical protein